MLELKVELSPEEVQEALAYWQKALFLEDWMIKVSIVSPEDIEGLSGSNTFVFENRSSCIRLACMSEEQRKTFISKQPMEQTLIHELLHCKYNWLCPPEGILGAYYDESEHALLEQLAKSLYMVKYHIDFTWFKNF